jgi:hypothetical protein
MSTADMLDLAGAEGSSALSFLKYGMILEVSIITW